ncbi:MAG: hypothetical protein JSW55_10690 [Chloroflexota bacterium]|nr:MAG: hypothetical protein JSW55_10690 [Chloroflexota bacterium]
MTAILGVAEAALYVNDLDRAPQYFRDPNNNSLELISADHYPLNWRLHVAQEPTG